ncbi:MAG: purine-binding chemotaxis protein CheW [Planctomycetota bacterium]|nr:MAG: purine-binding chemotaxis protein CheW [Planctomycetota bacterium]
MSSSADTTSEKETSHSRFQDLAGKYLTFVSGTEEFGLGILKVQEIIGMMKVTRVPRVSTYIRGVINLRGKVIPIIDLRLRFGMDATDDTDRTCIVVVQVSRGDDQVTMGIVVDQVSEVMDIPAEAIEPPPRFGQGVQTNYLLGIGKIADKVIMLLDIDRVLSEGEVAELEQVAV